MDLQQAFLRRESCRAYADRPVEEDKLRRVLEAALLAPSSSNSQPWRYTVVRDRALLTRIADLSQGLGINAWLYEAPCIIAVGEEVPERLLHRYGQRYLEGNWSSIDIGLSVGQLCLQAAQEGLGTCILGWFDREALKALLQLPEKQVPRLLISLGYAKAEAPPRRKVRRPFDELVRYIK